MLIKYLPFLLFLFVYTLLGGLGSLLLLFQIEPFPALYKQFSGVILPTLSISEQMDFLLILIGGPTCMLLGYILSLKLAKRFNWQLTLKTDITPTLPLALIVYAVFLAGAIQSIYLAKSATLLSSWYSYASWIDARYVLFDSLSFFQFVNIYVWLPTIAALVLLIKPRSLVEKIIRWLPLILAICMNLLLFQKKPVLIAVIFSLGALLVSSLLRKPEKINRTLRFASLGFLVMFLIYCIIAMIPFYGDAKTKNHSKLSIIFGIYSTSVIAPLPLEPKPISGIQHTWLSLIFRSPGPMLFYPIIFPKQKPWYPLDLGQDIIGYGTMPNDNHVIFQAMYPKAPKGCASAPVNFVFYSQGGIYVMFASMVAVGMLLGLFWYFILNSKGGLNTRSLLGITLLLFSTHLTIDSLRNTTIVSYGLFWAVLLIVLLARSKMAYAIHDEVSASRVFQPIDQEKS